MSNKRFLPIFILIMLISPPITTADNSSTTATTLYHGDSEYDYVCAGNDCDVGYDEYDWYKINPVTGDIFDLEIRNQGYPDMAYLTVEGWDDVGNPIDWTGAGDYVYSIPDTSTVTFTLSGNGIMELRLSTVDGWGGDGTYYWINVTQDITNRDSDGDGTIDTSDACPFDSTEYLDTDNDGVCDGDDWSPNDSTQHEDNDGDGYGDNPDGNQGDKFPNDQTQWFDNDGDGYGDNADGNNPDHCRFEYGTSIQDRNGCIDTDADGYSDPDAEWPAHPTGSGDAFANNPSEWLDSDLDEYGDNSDTCPLVAGNSTQASLGCIDSDNDGWADDYGDSFPNDSSQWADTDGDRFGDNPDGNNSDHCPLEYGTSVQDRNGCIDTDYDGYSDPDAEWLAHPNGIGDAFVNDSYEWQDSDEDGTGDNSDAFPNDATEDTDTDNDTVGDNSDVFPSDPTESVDSDKDGTGDNSDAFPNDGTEDTDSDNDTVGDNSDAFPSDPSETVDSDLDGVGDNSDDCKSESGTSSKDRVGCIDSDGDGYSDQNGFVSTISSKAFDEGDPASILLLFVPIVLVSAICFVFYKMKKYENNSENSFSEIPDGWSEEQWKYYGPDGENQIKQ